ncbi:MAG TPA: thioesterase family protein [Actinomycetota bacterium]|nr:thioesterase family protein [Actinomycetota bacterium]
MSDEPREPASITIQRRIEWSDTDASGAWHNSAAFNIMESAEVALVDSLGMRDDIYGRHPRVHIEADFLAPLWFRDVVDCEVRVAKVGRTSVTYDVEIRRAGETCVRGRLVAVLLDRIGGTPQPWPDDYRRQLERAGPQPGEHLVTGD